MLLLNSTSAAREPVSQAHAIEQRQGLSRPAALLRAAAVLPHLQTDAGVRCAPNLRRRRPGELPSGAGNIAPLFDKQQRSTRP